MKKLLIIAISLAFNDIVACAQTYTMPTSGSATYTTCSGSFYDDGGPLNDYSMNVNGVITFHPTPGGKISVNFTSFHSSEYNDFLYVYNGTDTSSINRIGLLTGQSGYGTITSTSPEGSLTFYFKSDGSHFNGEAGWEATISCSASPPDTITMLASGSVKTCGGKFYDGGGPAGDYMGEQNSIFTITPSTAAGKVSVNFTSFHSSEYNDLLYVYNGTDTSSINRIGLLTGQSGYGTITSTSPEGSLTFYFKSDGSHFNGEAGWEATISCSASPPDTITMLASGSVKTCGGKFYDGGGPAGDYMGEQNSIFTITPSTAAGKVSVNFTSFHSSEYNDLLYVYNGTDTSSINRIGLLTGQSGYGTITSTSPEGSLTFYFKSDGSHFNGEAGWEATISCSASPPDTITMLASGSVKTCGGKFYDGGGPAGDYMGEQNSIFTITPSTAAGKVSVNFTSFHSSEYNDLLYVYNGTDTSSIRRIGTLTGQIGDTVFTSTSPEGSLTFYFKSDGSHFNGETGWESTISCGGAVDNSITGTVVNPGISDLSGGIQNTLVNCEVKIYKAGTNTLVGDTTASNGNFMFTGLQNQNYDLLASYIANGITYSVKELNVPDNASNVQLKLSGNLIAEIQSYNDSLSNLTCYLDDLGHKVSVTSYIVSASNTYINAQNQIGDNQSKTIESLERLCMAERLLKKYYDQASSVNNEFINSTSEFAKFLSDLLEIGDCGNTLQKQFAKVLIYPFVDLFKYAIEIPIDNSTSSFKNYYQIALDIIVDKLKNGVSFGTVYDFLKEPIDRILTDKNLQDIYIANTLNEVTSSVYNAQNKNYSGDIHNTIANLNLQLDNSNVKTEIAEAQAISYRTQIPLVQLLTYVSNLALSCTPNIYFGLLAGGLDLVHAGFLGASIYESVERQNELVFESNQTVQSSFSRIRMSKWNLFNRTLQAARLQGSATIVSAFENEYRATLADINAGNTSTFTGHLNQLSQLNEAVNDSVTEELNGIKAAIPFSNITDSMYINNLQNTLFGSPFVRYANIAAISYYIQNMTDSLKDSLNYHSHNLITADSLMLIELSNMEGVLTSVHTPAYITVNGSNIPLQVQPNSSTTVTIKIKNYGSTPASNVYAMINFDGLFTSSLDSVFIGNLSVNQTDSFSFNIHAPATTDTISYYSIRLFADSAITNPRGGAIVSKNQIVTSVGQTSANNFDISVYPNPTNSSFFIKLNLNTANEVSFKLFNLMGQLIYQSPTYHFSGEQTKEINEVKLAAGLYLLQTKIGNESFVQKIIINR